LALTRRTFIVSAAATGGALAVGFHLFSPPSVGAGQDTEVLNWVVVAPDNTITIRIAQMEMGQGTMTTMAQLLAEELEADWSTIKTEYISLARHLTRGKVYGRTETSSGAALRLSDAPLRTVGAQIRTMLLGAAAKRLGVPEEELVAQDSVITHRPTGRKLSYGELAQATAKLAVPDPATVKLKGPKEWKYIGKSMRRVDIPSKTDGTAVFGIDVRLPQMKYAAIAICPVFGGRLKAYDAKAALSQPGVRQVVPISGGRAGHVKDMDDAIKIEPDNIGVLIPRAAVMLPAGRNAPSAMGKPVLRKVRADFERVYNRQKNVLDQLGEHPLGELRMGLADVYRLLGEPKKSKTQLEAIQRELPDTVYAKRATVWLAAAPDKKLAHNCIGCHSK
jgi:hypothetical protein